MLGEREAFVRGSVRGSLRGCAGVVLKASAKKESLRGLALVQAITACAPETLSAHRSTGSLTQPVVLRLARLIRSTKA